MKNGTALQSRFHLPVSIPESAKLVGGTASDPRHLHSLRRDPEQGRVRCSLQNQGCGLESRVLRRTDGAADEFALSRIVTILSSKFCQASAFDALDFHR
jgi:hypothetical protein